MDETGGWVCVDHIEDAFLIDVLQRDIAEADKDHSCDFCGKSPAGSIDPLVEAVGIGLHRLYVTADDAGMPWDEGDYVFPVMTTAEAVEDLGGFNDWDVSSAVASDLEENAWVPRDDPHVSKAVQLTRGWSAFAQHVAHESRYLLAPPAPADPYDPDPDLDPTEVLPLIAKAIRDEFDLVRTIDIDTVLYRARTFDDDMPFSRQHEMVSPPPEFAAQGRMNGAGISVLYAAFDEETAASEVYDGKEYAAIARLRPKRRLTVVDLTSVPKLSPYEPNMPTERFENAQFLAAFASMVTRPVVRDGRVHYEYAATQMFTEYLRWRLLPQGALLDGIVYRSAHGQGANIVVFAGPAGCLSDDQLPDDVTRRASEEEILELMRDQISIRRYGPPPSTALRWTHALL